MRRRLEVAKKLNKKNKANKTKEQNKLPVTPGSTYKVVDVE